MRTWIREVKAKIWCNLAPNNKESIQAAVDNLIGRSGSGEVSVYRSRSSDETELIGIALTRAKSKQPFDYLEICDRDLSAVGARVRRSRGKWQHVIVVNLWHFDVDLSCGRAERLVRRLAEPGVGEVHRIQKKELRQRARQLHRWQHTMSEKHWLRRRRSAGSG